MKKLGIFGYYGYENTGDEAILASLKRGLKQAIPDIDPVVFSGNSDYTASMHEISSVTEVLPRRPADWIVRSLGRNRSEFFRSWAAFRACDAFLFGGGGLFYDHPDSHAYLDNLFNRIEQCKRSGRKVAVAGVSIGPLHHAASRSRLGEVLNQVDAFIVRDRPSAELAVECGVDPDRVQVTADLVFLLEAAQKEQALEALAREGVEDSGRPMIGLCLYGRASEANGLDPMLVSFCRWLIAEYDCSILLVPMQTSTEFDDRPFARRFAKQLGKSERIHALQGPYSPAVTMAIMNQCEAIVAMRLHGAILAINNGTPLLGLNYMPKVERLFHEIGQPEWQIPVAELNEEWLRDGFTALWEDRSHRRHQLEAALRSRQEAAQKTFELLRKALI